MTCQQTTTDYNWRQKTLPGTLKQHMAVSWDVWQCLFASVVVSWHVMFPGDALGLSGGCLGGVLCDIHGNWRRSDVFVEYMGSQSLQYGANTLFLHSPERKNFFHLTILRH